MSGFKSRFAGTGTNNLPLSTATGVLSSNHVPLSSFVSVTGWFVPGKVTSILFVSVAAGGVTGTFLATVSMSSTVGASGANVSK